MAPVIRDLARRHALAIAYMLLGMSLVVTVALTLHQADERASGDAAALRAACEDRNQRDALLVAAITRLATQAAVPLETLAPITDALGPRDCEQLYP